VAWLEMVDEPDATFLLANGWLPFLTSFEKPDIKLWHNIVNNFHELHGGQLDAAYWIMAHQECD